MSVSKAFGVVLRRHRRAKKWTQEKLASEAGLDRVFVSNLETAKYQPTITTLFDLALALELAPSELVSDVEGEMVKTPSTGAALRRKLADVSSR